MIEILISGLAVFSTRHSTTWLWPVRPIQTRCLTRSSPSCRRKTSTSHRKGKNSRYLPVFWLVCSLLDQMLMFPHCSHCLSSRYTLKCQTWGDFGKVTMAFELEVCLLQRPEVVGVRRQRLKGDAWVYKHLVEDILSTSSIWRGKKALSYQYLLVLSEFALAFFAEEIPLTNQWVMQIHGQWSVLHCCLEYCP